MPEIVSVACESGLIAYEQCGNGEQQWVAPHHLFCRAVAVGNARANGAVSGQARLVVARATVEYVDSAASCHQSQATLNNITR